MSFRRADRAQAYTTLPTLAPFLRQLGGDLPSDDNCAATATTMKSSDYRTALRRDLEHEYCHDNLALRIVSVVQAKADPCFRTKRPERCLPRLNSKTAVFVSFHVVYRRS